uniref:Splicing factor U2AF-associated protein 2 n=2 Tax=Auxenochlorella protothecoides TaxID=3075 RepID=A0A1D1ZUN1_AUXPR
MTEAATAGDEPIGWCYLDASSQSQGPFPLDYLQRLQQAGYFHAETLFWREGQAEWKHLQDLPDLHASLEAATLAAAPPPAAQGAAVDGSTGDGPAAPQDDLSTFMAEISALDAEADDGPSTPPPEEQTFTDDDGTVYSWDPATRKFLPQGQGGPGGAAVQYNPEDMVFEGEELDIPDFVRPGDESSASDGEEESKKKKAKPDAKTGKPASEAAKDPVKEEQPSSREALLAEAKEKAAQKKQARAASSAEWFELKRNTSVYVTGLPEDVTLAEMVETFSKCGIIKEDDQRQPRIKIYQDSNGMPKGDGLVTFLKEPSVDLAVQLLDGVAFRYGLQNMTVSPAKFELKGEGFKPKQSAGNKKRKKKVLESLEKQALTWDGFDDKLAPTQVTVIIKHMFTIDEILENPLYSEEIERDVLAEAGRLGRVEKVKVYKGNPDGVVSIKFATGEAADKCVKLMEGRFFARRRLAAFMWDGYTNYNMKLQETEEQQAARLEAFGRELEEGGKEQ